jgi:hypothetical protein
MGKKSQLSRWLSRRRSSANKLTTITLETSEVVVVRQPRSTVRCWCEACSLEVEMLPAAEAALLLGVTLRKLCRQVDLGSLHYAELEAGVLLICLNSLAQQP